MKKAITNLLKIKSLLSLTGMLVFGILALSNRLSEALISSILVMIFQSFFTKDVKDKDENKEDLK